MLNAKESFKNSANILYLKFLFYIKDMYAGDWLIICKSSRP